MDYTPGIWGSLLGSWNTLLGSWNTMGGGYLLHLARGTGYLCLPAAARGGRGERPGTGQTSSRKADGEREGQGTLSTPAGPRGSGTAHLFRVRKKIGRDTTSFVCRVWPGAGGTARG
jgi:hypothetical protein